MDSTGVMTADQAAATAACLAGAQVVSACPALRRAGPFRELVKACARGGPGIRFVRSTSQRQAMAVLIGAAQAGARTFTAASSQSLAHSHEMLFWAAQARLPIVMANPSSPLGPGLNYGSDASDCAAQRDCGWIQIFCETAQEVLDNIIIAYRVALETSLPAMVSYDPSVLSESCERVSAPDEGAVRSFVGQGDDAMVLGEGEPRSFGCETAADSYTEFRMRMEEAIEGASRSFEKAARDFAGKFGRSYASVEPLFTKGSDTCLVACGSMAGTARAAVESMRNKGELAGLIKMRMLRPFPLEHLLEAAGGAKGNRTVKRLAVLDRNAGHGAGGVWSQEIRAALAGMREAPQVICVHAGLGGRDVGPDDIARAYEAAREAQEGTRTIWL